MKVKTKVKKTSAVWRRGFGSMSPERRKEIAGKGGKTAQLNGTAHRFSHEEAVAAGKIGGKARTPKSR